jgi:hypothetical protein
MCLQERLVFLVPHLQLRQVTGEAAAGAAARESFLRQLPVLLLLPLLLPE